MKKMFKAVWGLALKAVSLLLYLLILVAAVVIGAVCCVLFVVVPSLVTAFICAVIWLSFKYVFYYAAMALEWLV